MTCAITGVAMSALCRRGKIIGGHILFALPVVYSFANSLTIDVRIRPKMREVTQSLTGQSRTTQVVAGNDIFDRFNPTEVTVPQSIHVFHTILHWLAEPLP